MLKEGPKTDFGHVLTGRNEFFKSKAKSVYSEKQTHTICFSGIGAPFGNALFQNSTPMEEKEAKELVEWLNCQKLPAFWWEAPRSPTPVAPLLQQKGLQFGGLLTGVCRQLHPAMFHDPVPLEIKQVNLQKELKTFCQLVFPLHGVEPPVVDQLYQVLEPDTQSGHDLHYLAYREQQPVGGITLSLRQTAGVWNFAVHPDFLKQGIGSALIQTALQEAHQRGYRTMMAILTSHETTLWQKLGFQEVCQFPFHLYLP